MPRITKRQERGRALLEYQQRLALEQQEAAKTKAVVLASKAASVQPVCEVPPPVIADTDASVHSHAQVSPRVDCVNCGQEISAHCTRHMVPCCPGMCPLEK